MKALLLADLNLKPSEGIYKKICAESAAIGRILGSCELITKVDNGVRVFNPQTKKVDICENQTLLAYASNSIESKQIEFLYVRHMIPRPSLINVLRKAKINCVQIYYEIPTYPFFAEQFRTSKKKYRAIAKIILDVIFAPIIYSYVNKVVVIKSNSQVYLRKKMIESFNGVDTKQIQSKQNYESGDGFFKMVTVGTLYPYHGYDRVLKGLSNCNETVCGKTVEFHIVGKSETINELHELAKRLKLQHVYFHGMKTTEELNSMFEQFDVGLGCLALHRRNADIDTTLKVIEYYCRGVPVVTSGMTPLNQLHSCTIRICDDETPISIENIYIQYKNIIADELMKLSQTAREKFDWENIMKGILQ